jgi:transposase
MAYFMASLAPETCLEHPTFATLIRDPIRQAVAETFIGAVCPRVSMAPVLAITGMVAGTANRASFDPVGEISKPFVTGPNPSRVQEEEDRMRKDKRVQGNRRERKELARRLKSEDPGLEVVHPDAAGIDVGNEAHYVAVRGDRDPEPVRRFECFTADLYRMADWLQSCGVKTIAMQSTGVYWIPVYDILEEFGFQVFLVNARHTKNLPGRKSDVQESQWLLKLHTYGLLNNSFQPPSDIRVLRTYWRQRAEHAVGMATCIQRMQKALTQMNIQLANVISDLSGRTGQAIVRAILAGERDAKKLAKLTDCRIRATRDEVAKSLEGNWRPELLFVLQQQVEMYDIYQRRIAECDQKLQQHLSTFENSALPLTKERLSQTNKNKSRQRYMPQFSLSDELVRITGVDLTKIDGINVMIAQTLISEIGLDMSRWKTEAHFASWLGLCPDNRISGDKVLSRGTRRVVNRAATALRIAANTLLKSRSYLGAQYRRLRTKLGAPKAITAMAHRLARLVYRMLKYGDQYIDRGAEYYEQKNRQQQIDFIRKRAAQLGLVVTGACV